MVKMEKLLKNEESVRCTVYVEGSKTGIPVVYYFKTKQMTAADLPEGYEWCASHMGFVKRYLASLEKVSNVPENKTIMWY